MGLGKRLPAERRVIACVFGMGVKVHILAFTAEIHAGFPAVPVPVRPGAEAVETGGGDAAVGGCIAE